MKKCFYLSLLFSTLLLSCMFVINVSYASVNLTYFEEINYNGDKYDFVDNVVQNYFGIDLNNIPKRQGELNNWNQFFNDLIGTTYNYMYITNDRVYTSIWLTNNIDFQSPNTIREYTIYKVSSNDYILYYSVSTNATRNINGNQEGTIVNKYLKTDKYYDSVYNSYKPSFTPLLDFNYLTNYRVIFDNENCLAYVLPYSSYTWLLGQATNFNEFDEVVFKLRDKNNIVVASFTYSAQGTFDMPMYMSDIGNLWIQSRIVEYRKLYKLEYEAWLNGTIVDNFYRYVVFLPTNSVVDSSGDVITIGSGDFNSQDAVNNIINTINELNSSGDVSAILSGDFFSGDSGEIYARFGYKDYNNPYKGFIERCFYGIMTTLTSSGNVQLVWPVYDKSIVLNSDDFQIQSILFKVFISSILIFFIIYKFYAKFKNIIDELQEGNINYTLEYKDGKYSEYWFF